MTVDVLVYLEIENNSVLNVSKEIISYVRNKFSDCRIIGAVFSDIVTINNALDDIKTLNIEQIYLIKSDLLYKTESNTVAVAVKQLVEQIKPNIFLIGATANGREIAPRIASKLNIGLTADCTELSVDETGSLLATRPTYGGKMMATIYSKTLPNFATIRPGAFKLIESYSNVAPIISDFVVDFSNIINRIEILKSELISLPEDWTTADVIISGGAGLGSKENFELIYKFAEKINAKPAASRIAVEKGWAPHDIQVGQTGLSVSPKLYIAFGISGAMQHIVGITNSNKIIAVNTDETAPIMSMADIAIKADAVAMLKNLLNY